MEVFLLMKFDKENDIIVYCLYTIIFKEFLSLYKEES